MKVKIANGYIKHIRFLFTQKRRQHTRFSIVLTNRRVNNDCLSSSLAIASTNCFVPHRQKQIHLRSGYLPLSSLFIEHSALLERNFFYLPLHPRPPFIRVNNFSLSSIRKKNKQIHVYQDKDRQCITFICENNARNNIGVSLRIRAIVKIASFHTMQSYILLVQRSKFILVGCMHSIVADDILFSLFFNFIILIYIYIYI